MDLKKSKRLLIILAVIYWLFAVGIYAVANEQFRYSVVSGSAPSPELVIGEIVDGMALRQRIKPSAEAITSIELLTATYSRANTGEMTIQVEDSSGVIVLKKSVDIADLLDNDYYKIELDEPLFISPDDYFTIDISTTGSSKGNAVTLYAGNTFSIDSSYEAYQLNGVQAVGTLCVRANGYNQLSFYKTYWLIVVSAFFLIFVYTAYCWKQAKMGKSNPLVSVCTVYSRYSFLIKQLVSRDFKTKYKRSVLGMAWSFMNPLLTMSVQYIVFSTLFKSDIPNYPVYLLTGIVFFSFFNEAVTMGMTSITGNAALIKKVYMPKYIYPVSRILSSLVNFAFALMPLFLVMLFTRTKFAPSMFLLLYVIVCMLAFIVGMTLLLTTAMTFFQDTQFLWSVVSMMWQYMTPIFYPESIIPTNLMPLFRLNPMYQFISFARTCVSGGISPDPAAYFNCLAAGGLFMLLGIFVFKKYQNKFVLYI